MQDSVSSPASPASASPTSAAPRPRGAALASAAGLFAKRHPGVRPPQDVRQTCVLMLVSALAYGPPTYLAWDRLDSGVSDRLVNDLWILLVLAVLVGVALAALAVPVRRGGHVLWRSAQFGALIALGVALSTLYMAARLSDTPLLLAGLLGAAAAIVVNIALWSTEVCRWCDL